MTFSRRLIIAATCMALLALSVSIAMAGGPVRIADLRVSKSHNTSRLVLELTDTPNFSINRLKNPDRLYIDIHDSSVSAKKTYRINNGLLGIVRYAQYDNKTVRVVMEMSPGYTYKVFRLSGPPRIVVDFFAGSQAASRRSAKRIVEVKKPTGPVTNSADAMAMARWKLQEVEKKKARLKAKMNADMAARKPVQKPVQKAAVKPSTAGKPIAQKPATLKPVKKNTGTTALAALTPARKNASSGRVTPEEKRAIEEQRARKLADARAKALRKSANKKPVASTAPTIVVEKPSKKSRQTARNKGKFKLYRVVIDAGHGGKDPGAIGPGGLKEKTVVLDIAKRLKRKLEKTGGYEVILTRNSDRFLELEDRTRFANRMRADLFVSIHANASRNKRTRGLETYYLNSHGDDDTIKIAARENSIPIEEMQRAVDKTNKDYLLASLATQHKQQESNYMASHVLKRMYSAVAKRYHGVTTRPSKMGPFYVLYGARMPAVLVEVSYITNKTEASRLKTSTYRDYLAAGIAAGIKDYIKEAGRRGDQLAAKR